jgi:hypothetical protein
VPRTDAVPLFVQADFGLDEDLQPKLVEIQGFPSLYAYQPVLAETYSKAYGIDPRLAALPDGLTPGDYWRLLGKAILAEHDPETVVLLEIDPWRQKTRHDFVVSEERLGLHTLDIRAVRQRGARLYYDRHGVETPIRRIYNRVIADELQRRRIEVPFAFRDDLEVEWAGHPNWFFLLSKFSLPYIQHPAVPWTRFLDQVEENPNSQEYVVKPLYSFAGAGVIVGPTAEQLAAIPDSARHNYVLQKRVNFRPVVDTPAGPTKIEVRIMYIWLDRLRPVNTVIRMGRGAQMGVDHNRQMDWVGGSAAFLDEESEQ